MTDTPWVETIGLIAARSNTPFDEVMKWPLPAIAVYVDRVLPLLAKGE